MWPWIVALNLNANSNQCAVSRRCALLACSADLGGCTRFFMANFLRHHVSSLFNAAQRWQGALLLESVVELWRQLGLDAFWRALLPRGRQGARWDWVLQTRVLYRLIDPGAEPSGAR